MNAQLSEPDTDKVIGIIAEQLDVKRDQVTPEARIMDDLGADSLDIVEITIKLEERFNVTIPDEEWDKVQTVGELQTALAEFLQPAAASQ